MNVEIFLIKLLLVLPHIHKIFKKFDLLRFKHYVLNFKILGGLMFTGFQKTKTSNHQVF